MRQSLPAIAVLLMLSLIWGSTWIANSMLPEPGAPLHTTALRYALGCVLLGLASVAQTAFRRARRPTSEKSGHDDAAEGLEPGPAAEPALMMPFDPHGETRLSWIGISALLGLTMFGIPDLLLVWASHHGAAAWTPLIYAGLPLGLVLAAGELRGAAVLGLGAMLVLLNGSFPLSTAKMLWALLIVAAVAMQGWSLIYASRRPAVAASVRGCMVQLMSALCLMEVALKLWPEAGAVPLRDWPAASIAALCLLAALATAFAYPVYYRLLRTMEPAQLATSAWLQTMVAVGESALLLRQRPGWAMMAAAFVLVGCTLLLLRQQQGATQPLLRLSS